MAICAAVLITGGVRADAETILSVALDRPVTNLDPARMTQGPEYTYANLVFNGLTYIDRDMKVVPDLAESWSANDDLTVWTFKLRQPVNFHNGKLLDADDVVWTFQRILDPKTASRMRGNLSIVDKIEAVDGATVRFSLKAPYADLPAVLADYQGRIVPKGSEELSKQPIGTGPFKFIEYVPGDRLVVSKNADYWEKGLPKVDGVKLRFFPEAASAVASLEAGEIDILADIRAEQVRQLTKSKSARVDTVPSGFWFAFVLRNDVKPFDNPKVRHAFLAMMDKTQLTMISALGQGTPALTPVPPYHPYALKAPIPAADPEKAKALLREAGYPDGLSVTLWFPNSDSEAERAGVAFRDQARKAGVTVELKGVPGDKFYADVEGKEPFTTTNFFGRPTPDTMLYAWFDSKGSWNQSLWAYKSAEMDKLLEAGRQLVDESARTKVYQDVQKLILADAVSPIVYLKTVSNAVGNNVKDFKSSPRIWLELKGVSVAK